MGPQDLLSTESMPGATLLAHEHRKQAYDRVRVQRVLDVVRKAGHPEALAAQLMSAMVEADDALLTWVRPRPELQLRRIESGTPVGAYLGRAGICTIRAEWYAEEVVRIREERRQTKWWRFGVRRHLSLRIVWSQRAAIMDIETSEWLDSIDLEEAAMGDPYRGSSDVEAIAPQYIAMLDKDRFKCL